MGAGEQGREGTEGEWEIGKRTFFSHAPLRPLSHAAIYAIGLNHNQRLPISDDPPCLLLIVLQVFRNREHGGQEVRVKVS
jgi:hypothetical protein